jgi:amino acid transporter
MSGELRRVLSLRDLVLYGVILIQPIAPVGIFGIAAQQSKGHVTLAILAAMTAMMLTAWSYGRMASLWPTSGSAYAYVSRGIDARLGFLTGWAMFLDYLIIPVLNVVYIALTLHRLVPAVPVAVWSGIAVGLITVLNLREMRFTAKANQWLIVVMSGVLLCFFALAVRWLLGRGGFIMPEVVYNPTTFDVGALATATSLAALTYIGFDGVTTLAEEVRDPRRTLPAATVLTCLITGLLSAMEVYLAQAVMPDWRGYGNPETAFLDATAIVGGPVLFQAMGVVIVIACLGSGLAGQTGAARLLYGMGRDGVLPKRWFGTISSSTGTPTRNVLFVGLLAWAGATLLSYQRAAELLNFGAFLAFMGVNVAAAADCVRRRRAGHAAVPALGFVFTAAIWLSLPTPAKTAGFLWLAAGVAWMLVLTKGLRRPLPSLAAVDAG